MKERKSDAHIPKGGCRHRVDGYDNPEFQSQMGELGLEGASLASSAPTPDLVLMSTSQVDSSSMSHVSHIINDAGSNGHISDHASLSSTPDVKREFSSLEAPVARFPEKNHRSTKYKQEEVRLSCGERMGGGRRYA